MPDRLFLTISTILVLLLSFAEIGKSSFSSLLLILDLTDKINRLDAKSDVSRIRVRSNRRFSKRSKPRNHVFSSKIAYFRPKSSLFK